VDEVVTSPDAAVQGTLSPDGTQIVYSDGVDLYLMNAAGGDPRNLTATFEPPAAEPAFSADGMQIAFSTGDLYLLALTDGAQPTQLLTGGHSPSWSPDGQQIAYSTDPAADFQIRTRRGDLGVVDVASGQHRVIMRHIDAVHPHWSPAGDRIVFAGTDGLYSVRPDGSTVISLSSYVHSPRWIDGGRSLLWLWNQPTGTLVERLDVDPETGQPLGDEVPLFELPDEVISHLSTTADGSRWLLSTVAHVTQMLTVPLDPATGMPTGEPHPLDLGVDTAVSPDISADGQWLAFTSYGVRADLYTRRLDGSEPTRLIDDSGFTAMPRWSVDGQQLVFAGDRGDSWAIWSVDHRGENPRCVSGELDMDLVLPLWSPDGQQMAVTIVGDMPYLVDLQRAWMEQAGPQRRPEAAGWLATSWSPDGRWLALTREGRLARMDAQSLAIEPLLDRGGYPIWMADSQRLMVGEGSRVYQLDTRDGSTTDVLSIAPRQLPLNPSLALSPDNHTLLVTAESPRGTLRVVVLGDR